MKHCILAGAVVCACLLPRSGVADAPAAPDLMTFAQGVLPLDIDTGAADLRVEVSDAVAIIDGDPRRFSAMRKQAREEDRVMITYALPAPTLFARFAVPNVLETPSPWQSFFRHVEVFGASASADGPYVLLASAELSTHAAKGEVTELAMAPDLAAVRWIRLRLWGAIAPERDQVSLEFSELIGQGTQEAPPLSEAFDGIWSGRGVKIELAQDGASVTGCYDGHSTLQGTVEGNVLRALGTSDAGIASQFILIASPDGALRGLRSTNGAPFKPYDGVASDKPPTCLPQDAPVLGCGAIVHGIGFDFDSDAIRASSQAIIDDLFEGLRGHGGIQIIGHSSSEGSDAYNRDLSQRRAASVAAALVARGLEAGEITALGQGEDMPIASNDTEAGRSMNRRVEIQCTR